LGKKANDLDGKSWLRNSVSVWDDIKKSNEERKLKHPAMFPTMMCKRLIESFSLPGNLILDPFCGSGSTLIAASELSRPSIGFELSKEFVKIYNQRLDQFELFSNNQKVEAILYQENAKNLMTHVKPESVNLVITSPPYWNILNQKRTADGKDIRHYGNIEGDLGIIDDYERFLDSLLEIYKLVYETQIPGGYFCVILMDIRKRDKFFPFHIDTITRLERIGYELDDIIIWNRKHEYNNLRPLGYPSVFRINKIHEFILIFKK